MIIDAHSHIGHDWMMPESKIEDYDNFLIKHNINAGIIMPEPGHISSVSKLRYMLWKFNNDKIEYYSPHQKTSDFAYLSQTSQIINDEIYQIFKSYKPKNKLYYCAMINPILDDIEFIKKIKLRYNCVALKLHGIAGGFAPEMIDEEHIKAIKSTNLPLIIHTDYSKNQDGDLAKIRNMNTAKKWFKFLRKNNLKGYLCHGCRLDKETLKNIAKTDNILVGIGPHVVIERDVNRIVMQKPEFNGNYLQTIFSLLPSEKLAFDVDFNYLANIPFNMQEFIKALPPKGEKILGENAKKFFEL